MNVEGYIAGILPRNDGLIKIWKMYEAGRVTEDVFRDVLDKSIEDIISIQVENGFTYIHAPQIDWHDYFRIFAELDGIKAGPLTRYFENNTFYRKPIFEEFPKYREGLIADKTHIRYIPRDVKPILSLPGPYTFLRLSLFKNGVDPVKAVSTLMYNALKEALSIGYSKVILHEPSIAYEDDPDKDLLVSLYSELKDFQSNIRVHTYFGDVEKKSDILNELDVEGYSIDLQYTSVESVGCSDKLVIFGVIDAQNTLIEDIEYIYSQVSGYRERCKGDIAISNNTDLDFLPFTVAIDKINLLGNLLKRLRG